MSESPSVEGTGENFSFYRAADSRPLAPRAAAPHPLPVRRWPAFSHCSGHATLTIPSIDFSRRTRETNASRFLTHGELFPRRNTEKVRATSTFRYPATVRAAISLPAASFCRADPDRSRRRSSPGSRADFCKRTDNLSAFDRRPVVERILLVFI